MKIEEVVKVYEFLAASGIYGAIGCWFIVSFIIFYLMLMNKEKLKLDSRRQLFWTGGTVSLVLAVGFAALWKEADNRLATLELANCVKSEFIMSGYKVASRRTIIKDFHCTCEDSVMTGEELERVIHTFPHEFIAVNTDDDSAGVRIIDTQALASIDSYNKTHLPFMKSMILDFMKHNKRDSMTYFQIRDEINNDFDDEWLELMISTYEGHFIPFDKRDGGEHYGASHGIKIRKDEAYMTSSTAPQRN